MFWFAFFVFTLSQACRDSFAVFYVFFSAHGGVMFAFLMEEQEEAFYRKLRFDFSILFSSLFLSFLFAADGGGSVSVSLVFV